MLYKIYINMIPSINWKVVFYFTRLINLLIRYFPLIFHVQRQGWMKFFFKNSMYKYRIDDQESITLEGQTYSFAPLLEIIGSVLSHFLMNR